MAVLDRLLPRARLVQVDRVVVDAPPKVVWGQVRHGSLAASGPVRLLFALRTIPDRLGGRRSEMRLRIDDMRSSPDQPGFQALVEEPEREIAVGAIGKVWRPRIPFLHVADEAAYAAFADPGWIKVAWSLRVEPAPGGRTSLAVEVRVDGTSDDAWRRFRRYFLLVGPFSHAIRHALLAGVKKEAEGAVR